MNITVIGAGYVGLVTAACFAEVGNKVHCVDSDSQKVDALNRGEIPIYEPGLEEIVCAGYDADRLVFTTDTAAAIDHGEVIFIAVGTPPDEDGSADLKHVLEVAQSIGSKMDDYKVVVTKSTVPVGTARKVQDVIDKVLSERGADIAYSIVSNPEFLKEGAAIEDFTKPDRIIIGAEDEKAIALMRRLYAPFNRNHGRLILMDIESAELTKYSANAMLATKISFMNEIANLAEKLGADIEQVRQGIGSDPRIGYEFIYPGCGYGGSCFPKDVKALYKMAHNVGYDARLVAAVEAVNEDQKKRVVEILHEHFNGHLKDKKIALWGLSFKPNTDDIREAPSRAIIESLWESGAKVSAFDPAACEEIERLYGQREDLELNNEDPYAILDSADALVIVTEWKVFRAPDLKLIKSRLLADVVVDGRNIFNPDVVRQAGLIYYGIGRSKSGSV